MDYIHSVGHRVMDIHNWSIRHQNILEYRFYHKVFDCVMDNSLAKIADNILILIFSMALYFGYISSRHSCMV